MIFLQSNLFSQVEKLEVEGAIQISNSDDPTPDAGTIQWTGCDFEGWDGNRWYSLTGKSDPQDIIGNFYGTAIINGVEWMTENLKTTKYRDGTPIPHLQTNTSWSNDVMGGYCFPNNDPTNDNYGLLYNHLAIENNNVCPPCWRIPNRQEVLDLRDYLLDNNLQGGDLKELGFMYWDSPNTGATNSLNLSIRGAGDRSTGGFYLNFRESARIGYIFPNSSSGHFLSLTHDTDLIGFGGGPKQGGVSVRCVKE